MTWVLDTHVLAWAYLDDPRLSAAASRVVARARSDELLASDVTLTEFARIIADGNLAIAGDAQSWLREIASYATVVPVSDEIADRAIALRKSRRMKLGDAIIAATALVHDLIVVTRNTRDFEGIGVTTINPWEVA